MEWKYAHLIALVHFQASLGRYCLMESEETPAYYPLFPPLAPLAIIKGVPFPGQQQSHFAGSSGQFRHDSCMQTFE